MLERIRNVAMEIHVYKMHLYARCEKFCFVHKRIWTAMECKI